MSDPIENIISITWWRGVFQKTGRVFGWGCALVFGIPLVIGFGWNQFSGRNTQNTGAAARDAQLMTVNGEPVSMGEYYGMTQRAQMGTPGEEFARNSGEAIYKLVGQVVLLQEAKRAGVKPSDAEVDKAIADFKLAQVGKNATDADLENYLYQSHHITMAEFREQVSKSYLGKALFDDLTKKTVVTEEEARNQSAEVRLVTVLIPTAPVPGARPDPRALPDADAKKKAEALLAEAKSGKATIAAIARANSSDFTAKNSGDTDFMPEYRSPSSQMPASMGVMGFGKDFDEAVHKAKTGEYTDVIKASGFRSGYVFARVTDRRNNLPKDFVAKKAVDQLKEQRANEVLVKRRDEETKTAKVEFPADRLEQKAYYDFFLLSKMEQDRMMAFNNPAGAPTPDQVNKQKAIADSEIEAVYKKDPANTTAAVLILDAVKLKMGSPQTPPAEQTQLRERLLPLYQSVIKATEGDNYSYRFGLGDTLRDNKKFAEAYKNYHMVGRLLDTDIPTELKAMQDAKQVRERLAKALKSVASPEAPTADAEANAQMLKVMELNNGIAQAQAKAEEERRRQADEQKKQDDLLKLKAPPKPGGAGANTPAGFGKSLDLGSGSGQKTPAPSAAIPPKTLPAPTTPAAPAPGSRAVPPPPIGGPGR